VSSKKGNLNPVLVKNPKKQRNNRNTYYHGESKMFNRDAVFSKKKNSIAYVRQENSLLGSKYNIGAGG